MAVDEAAAVFDALRPHLHGVAYRLTSSWADAEDVVADAWPRWSARAAEVEEPRAWLTTVVARLALDHLRSARVRRESYVGPWLPEPLVRRPGAPSPTGQPDPLDVLVADESVRLAFLVVLDELTPQQRVALVLHDVLGIGFAEVADVLGCSVEAARQHAVRARRRVEAAAPAPRVPDGEALTVLAELGSALAAGDAGRLADLLAPDVVLTSDGAGEVMAAGRPLLGRELVTRFLVGLVELAARQGSTFGFEVVDVNGDPGFLARFESTRPRDPRAAVYGFAIRDGVVVRIFGVLAPAKLTRLPA